MSEASNNILKLVIGKDGSDEQKIFEIPFKELEKYEVTNNKESE